MLTKKKLLAFMHKRNQSAFNTNLQFQIDMEACGIEKEDIGDAIAFDHPDYGRCYRWCAMYGTLFEIGGKLTFLVLNFHNLDDKACCELFYYDKGWPKVRTEYERKRGEGPGAWECDAMHRKTNGTMNDVLG